MINLELVHMFIKKHLKTAIVIAICSGLLSFFLCIIFPSMDSEHAEIISSSWPQIMKDLFGDPVYAFTDIYGWLYLQVFHITFWAIFAIFGAILSSDIVAKEIEEKTIDVLLSYPINRTELITSRLMGLIFLITFSILPSVLGLIIGIMAIGQPLYLGKLFLTSFMGLILALNFSALALLISTFLSTQTSLIYITLSIMAGMFLYQELLTKIISLLKSFSFLSLFYFYGPEKILIHNSFSVSNPFILLITFLFFSFISSLIFSRKDILV